MTGATLAVQPAARVALDQPLHRARPAGSAAVGVHDGEHDGEHDGGLGVRR